MDSRSILYHSRPYKNCHSSVAGAMHIKGNVEPLHDADANFLATLPCNTAVCTWILSGIPVIKNSTATSGLPIAARRAAVAWSSGNPISVNCRTWSALGAAGEAAGAAGAAGAGVGAGDGARAGAAAGVAAAAFGCGGRMEKIGVEGAWGVKYRISNTVVSCTITHNIGRKSNFSPVLRRSYRPCSPAHGVLGIGGINAWLQTVRVCRVRGSFKGM